MGTMVRKWLKFAREEEFHYVEYAGVWGLITTFCGRVVTESMIDEMRNNLEHHDKCKRCYEEYHKRRDEKEIEK